MPEPWSYTRLQTYARCPLAYRLHYIDGETGRPSEATIRGSQVHEFAEAYALHCHHAGRETDYDWGREQAAGYEDEATRELCLKYVETTRFNWSLLVADGGSVEREFAVPLPHDLGELRGRVDRVQWNDLTSSLIVEDLKSGWGGDRPDECPPQLRCYAWAMKQVFPAARSVLAVMRYLGSGEAHEWTLYEPTPDWACAVVRRIAADERFEPTPSAEACAFCDHKRLCPLVTSEPLLHPTTEAEAQASWGQYLATYARAADLKDAVRGFIGKGCCLALDDGAPGPGYYPTQGNGRMEPSGDPVEIVRLVLAGLGEKTARGLLDTEKLGRAVEDLAGEGFGDAPEAEALRALVKAKAAGGLRWSDAPPKWITEGGD
jgi:hypothetical protein